MNNKNEFNRHGHRRSVRQQPLRRPAPSDQGGLQGGAMPSAEINFNRILMRGVDVIANLVEALIVLGGVLVLNVVDLASGAVTAANIFQHTIYVDTLALTPSIMGGSLSLATTFIQYLLWQFILRGVRHGNLWGSDNKKGAFTWVLVGTGTLIAIAVMIGDTALDMSIIDYIVEGTSPLEYNWNGHTPIRKIVDVTFAIVCAGNEMFLAMLGVLLKMLVEDEK